jgi:hydrogenase expression/formation protein HypE
VHGTCNDLAVAGATPRFLSLNAFIEEGLEIDLLERLVASMGRTAQETGVRIATGDTKVVPRGQGGGLYLATTGIGIRPPALSLGIDRIQPGDRLLVSGPVGDHGIAVMLAREEFGLRGDLLSDAASVLPFTTTLLLQPGLRFMRDPTRGGLATVAQEICNGCGYQVNLTEVSIPVRDSVRSVCDILGYDPLYLPSEGRVVAVVAEESADRALELWRSLPGGAESALAGEISEGDALVILETELGGRRILEQLEEDPLPRIC